MMVLAALAVPAGLGGHITRHKSLRFCWSITAGAAQSVAGAACAGLGFVANIDMHLIIYICLPAHWLTLDGLHCRIQLEFRGRRRCTAAGTTAA